MGTVELVVAGGIAVGIAVVGGLAAFLSRGRDRVMDYHQVETPRVRRSGRGGAPVD